MQNCGRSPCSTAVGHLADVLSPVSSDTILRCRGETERGAVISWIPRSIVGHNRIISLLSAFCVSLRIRGLCISVFLFISRVVACQVEPPVPSLWDKNTLASFWLSSPLYESTTEVESWQLFFLWALLLINLLLQWAKSGSHTVFLGSLKQIYFETKVYTSHTWLWA